MMLLQATFSTFDIISFISSITSIVLAIVSIVLAIVFYRWSAKSSQEITKQAQAIDSNTKKIETLFDKLYSGTFNMMKSSHQAMQNKLYGAEFPSGDSDSSEVENLQEFIRSVVIKCGQVPKKVMPNIVQSARPNENYKEADIFTTINTLIKDGVLIEQHNLLIISTSNTINNAESASKK